MNAELISLGNSDLALDGFPDWHFAFIVLFLMYAYLTMNLHGQTPFPSQEKKDQIEVMPREDVAVSA